MFWCICFWIWKYVQPQTWLTDFNLQVFKCFLFDIHKLHLIKRKPFFPPSKYEWNPGISNFSINVEDWKKRKRSWKYFGFLMFWLVLNFQSFYEAVLRSLVGDLFMLRGGHRQLTTPLLLLRGGLAEIQNTKYKTQNTKYKT